jgi:hypothetical protein
MPDAIGEMLAAIVGGVMASIVGGMFALFTLREGFRHERELKDQERRAKRKGASRAVMMEMFQNFTRLNLLSLQADSESPMGNLRGHLKVQRRAVEEYVPLLAEELKLDEVRDIIAAYFALSALFDQLEGKWAISSPLALPSDMDRQTIRSQKEEFEGGMLKCAQFLLTAEERQQAGLEPEVGLAPP